MQSVVRNADGQTVYERPVIDSSDFAARDVEHQACCHWLNTEFPNWQDPLAYWS